MNKQKEFLTVPEIAERWRCSREHVYNLIATGQLNAMNIGRRRYIVAADDAARFLSERRTVKAAA